MGEEEEKKEEERNMKNYYKEKNGYSVGLKMTPHTHTHTRKMSSTHDWYMQKKRKIYLSTNKKLSINMMPHALQKKI